MGWGSGTKIFDTVVEELKATVGVYESDKLNILTRLEDVLSDLDWDCQCESEYWDDPVIGRILGNDFEE
jgi:hypothetical protein